MERPEVVDPLKEEEQPILQQTPVEEPKPVETQTDDAFSVRGLAEKRLGKVGATVLDFVPIVGDVLAADDVAKSYKEGDAIGTAVNSLALAAGLIPIVGDVAAKGLKAGLKASRKPKKGEASKSYIEENAPKFIDEVSEAQTASKIERIDVSPDSKVVKSYKLFKTNKDGDLFPLFVKMEDNEPLPVGEWIKAQAGEINPKTGKVKSSIGDLAYRPGFHAGDLPIAPHIGGKMNLDTGRRLTGKTVKPNIREENQVWAEVEMLDDVDWQSVANSRASIVKSGPNKGKLNVKEAHITDQLPTGGHYRYKTNANMVGNWLIGGELKINRVLTSAEVKAINDKAGVADLPKLSDLGKLDLLTSPKAPTPKAPKAPTPKARGGAIRTYKEGGVVPMQEQMKFAFMNEGGFLDGQPHVFNEGGVLADDGINRDPVSGNEVPSGSMAKEVRDDVPAMLSEGEYVVPADVVRYHGIDKFEELRDEAKRGLARMEADGRIGGQPVEEQEEFPFPVEELQGFDEGGAVGDTYSDVMGSPFMANQRYGSLPTMGFELRNFTNPKTGQTVVIPFFNGKPMQYIPPDFLEGGATTTGGGVSSPVGDDGGRQDTTPRDTGMSDLAYEAASKALRGTETVPQTKPFSEYSTEDFRRYVQTRQGVLGRVMDAIPVVGILTSMQDNAAREFARRSLIQGRNIATGQPLTNNDAGVLMQVADLPKGRSVLTAIDDFLQGKTRRADGIVIDDTPPIDTELRRTTYEAETPIDDAPAATTDTTKEKAGTTTTEEDLPFFPAPAPDFVTQGGGTSAPTQTVDTQRDQLTSSKARRDSRGTKASNIFDMSASASTTGNIPGYAELKRNNTKQNYEDLLQRIVVTEAGQEDLIGQALVARAILNRKGVLDENFSPSTFYTSSNDLVDIIYGGMKETGVGNLLGGKVKTAIDQGRGFQFEPVGKGIITDPRRFNASNMATAKSAIDLAQNPTKLRQELRKAGYNSTEVKNFMSATGFANLETQEARGVKDDKTQDVNRIKHGKHTFNTAGNTDLKVYNPDPYENTKDKGAVTFAGTPPASPFQTGQAVAQPQDVSQFYGQRFDPTQIDTDDMLRQAAQNIPAGSDIGPSFQPLGLSPGAMGGRPTPPKAVPQSTLPFVQGPPVAPTVGSPAVSPATAQDTQMQQAFSIPRRDVAGTTTAPTIGGTGLSGTLPQVDTTTPVSRTTSPLIQDFAPMGDRKITDAREFLETRKAAQQAVDEALSFAPKTKPKEEEVSDAEYKRNVKEATDKVYDDARKRGDQARDEVLRQGGSVEEAYDAMHTAFTGFDRAGNMVSTDPGTQAMASVPTFGAFKEGGLASKPKKTKPKKRNTKKGLGGKMAT